VGGWVLCLLQGRQRDAGVKGWVQGPGLPACSCCLAPWLLLPSLQGTPPLLQGTLADTTATRSPARLIAPRCCRAGQGWPLPATPLFIAAEELSGLSVADDSTSLVLPGAGREGIDAALQQLLRCGGSWAGQRSGRIRWCLLGCVLAAHIVWQ
jgi:hypothetical protein